MILTKRIIEMFGDRQSIWGITTHTLLCALRTVVLVLPSLAVQLSPAQTAFINVKSFGAMGNGATNDIAAINTAMDAAFSQGKSLYFPAGTYLVGETNHDDRAMIRLRPGVRVYGDGDASVIQRIPVSGQVADYVMGIEPSYLYADSTKNKYEIDHLQLRGATNGRHSGMIPGTGEDGGIFIARGTHLKTWFAYVHDMLVRDFNKESIAIWDCDSAVITNNRVKNGNQDAFNPNGVRKLTVTGNTSDSTFAGVEYIGYKVFAKADTAIYALISNNTFTNVFQWGLAVYAGDSIDVASNFIQGYDTTAATFGSACGIFVEPSVLTEGEIGFVGNIGKFNITNNTIDRFVTNCIGQGDRTLLSTDGVLRKLVISNNILTNAGVSAISVRGYDKTKVGTVVVKNNSINNWNRVNTSNAYIYSAIHLSYVDSANISGNRIYNNRAPGYRYDPLYVDHATGVTFANNDCTSEKSPLYVIYSSVTKTALSVSGNVGIAGVLTISVTNVPTREVGFPGTFALEQNYPNPFNPTTTIRYQLPLRTNVRLIIYDTVGKQVAILVNQDQDAGYHEVRFDGAGLASGVYFYNLRAGDFFETKKLLLLK